MEARRKPSVVNFLCNVCICFLLLFGFVFLVFKEQVAISSHVINFQISFFFGVYSKAGNLFIVIHSVLTKTTVKTKEKSVTFKGKYGIQT